MWNYVTDTVTIQELMDKVCFFHDSCIKEIRYISGAYIDNELFMHPTNSSRKLSVIIQRQTHINSVIELEFTKLKYLRLIPLEEKYTCEILGATLLIEHGYFVWFDCADMSVSDMEKYDGVVVCAEGLRWRAIDVGLGSQEYFEKQI